VAVGPVTLCLEQGAYQQFVVMLNESAANLESLMDANRTEEVRWEAAGEGETGA
jgi:hypothetical protein